MILTKNIYLIMKRIKYTILAALLLTFSFISQAQSYSSADFVGEWHGEIFNRYDGTRQTSIMLYSNGDYTESSGNLMPSIYPNTQKWEYEASTNRLHFWWLQTVYAGQKHILMLIMRLSGLIRIQ